MFQKNFAILFLSLFVFLSTSVYSQTFNDQDFSNIKVENLSDAQVRQFIQQIEASGLGEAQLEQVALAKGMPISEVAKLRKRVAQIKKQDIASDKEQDGKRELTIQEEENTKEESEKRAQLIAEKRNSRIFGATLFSNTNMTFEPNLRIATPVNYQIGPDDEILIDIYGYSEANYNLVVSPEGTINIPLVGIVSVAGATMEQAASRIQSRMTKIYPSINSGTTKLGITLGNIRSIKVVLTGEIVKPGTYTLPSVANVFNALYASGGPNDNGSFRQVQIIRGNEIIAVLDIYDFLLYGSLQNNIRLQDQDVIRIPAYKTRVEINGEVKRPGIFEMKFNETLGDLIRFAGGFTEDAYKARIKVIKNTDIEKAINDIESNLFENYVPTTGDKYYVDKILDRFANRVTIKGAVFRPGEFELSEGLTLSELIKKADGLKEDAFTSQGFITRLKPDLTKSMLSFNPVNIVSGKDNDIILQREDIVTIPSIFDLQEAYFVSILGEVRSPGNLEYAEGMTLEEAIILSGGFKESASPKRIEVARRIKSSNILKDTTTTAQIFTVNIDKDLESTSGFVLKPFDIVSIFPMPGYQRQQTVLIEGEVLFPGSYTISHKNERISDIIKRAGGLTESAYIEGASLKRERKAETILEREKEEMKIEKIKDIKVSSMQDTNMQKTEADIIEDVKRNNFVGIDLEKIIDAPGRRYDLLLEDGDIISIPKLLQTVKVNGEVLSPSAVIYKPSQSFRKYILNSGGFKANAYKKRAYITYANGSVEGTRNFLFFKNYPKVKPGAEIFVPFKPERENKLTTTEIVAISTALTTIATLVYTIFSK